MSTTSDFNMNMGNVNKLEATLTHTHHIHQENDRNFPTSRVEAWNPTNGQNPSLSTPSSKQVKLSQAKMHQASKTFGWWIWVRVEWGFETLWRVCEGRRRKQWRRRERERAGFLEGRGSVLSLSPLTHHTNTLSNYYTSNPNVTCVNHLSPNQHLTQILPTLGHFSHFLTLPQYYFWKINKILRVFTSEHLLPAVAIFLFKCSLARISRSACKLARTSSYQKKKKFLRERMWTQMRQVYICKGKWGRLLIKK